MNARVVFEDDEIQLVHRPGRSDFTLATFAAFGHRPNGTWVWAQEPIAKLELEAIGFVAKRKNWYPAASMHAAAEATRRLLRPRTIGYGFSMGGYAVLKYGRMLGLSHGLAISPQVTINPAEVPQDRRFHKFHDPALHGGMRVSAGDAPPVSFVVADPYWTPDATHLTWATREAGAVPIRMPFLKHAAMQRFKSSRLLAQLCDLVLGGDEAAIRDFLRQDRAHSAEASLWLGSAAEARGHATIAAGLWARAGALGAREADVLAVRAVGLRDRLFALLQSGRHAEARAIADETLRLHAPMPVMLRHCARALLKAGMPDLARLGFERSARMFPHDLDARLGLLEALRDMGSGAAFDEAKASAMQAFADTPAAIKAIARIGPAPAARRLGTRNPDGRIVAAALRADWAMVLRIARGMAPAESGMPVVNVVVTAALMDGSAEAAAFAGDFARAAVLPLRHRVAHAGRLGQAGFVGPMLAVLNGEPGSFEEADPATRNQVIRLLSRARDDANLPRPIRDDAAIRAARLRQAPRPANVAIRMGPDGATG